MIKTRKAPARFLSALLCLMMVLTLLPTVAFAAPGDTADNPVVCTNFADFKAAMEDTAVTYVKLNGVSGTAGQLTTHVSLAAAISNTTDKVLTIEGTNTFYSPLDGMNDCLIWPRSELTINGTGTLKYEHGNTGGTGAVINMTSNVPLTINGNVTLEGGANGNTFGYAIFAQAGTTTINGGSFIGYNAFIANHAAMSAVSISSSANLTINGGNFSASLHPSSPAGKKAHSLSIPSTATGAISIKAGTFSQGIDIDATGKTITTCGYFDTTKASITAGGNPVGATASTDVLKSTPVIVTDTSVIGSVTVAVTAPVAGAATTAPTTSTANVAVSNSQWTIRPGGTGISSFEGGKTYRCAVVLNPASGYTFNSGTTVTIGGQTATIDSQSTTEIRAHYDFTTSAVPVSSVAISVTAPTAGATPAAPTTSTANVSIIGYQWKISGGSNLDSSTAFEAGKTYRLEMTINPTTGQTLSNTATATVNGNAATVWDQSTSYLNCYYEFTIPAAVVPVSSVAISVTAPTAGTTPSAPTTSTANVSIVGHQWKLGGNPLAEGATFEYGKTYRLEMTINPTTGQSLSTTATATVNGNAATVMDQSTSYLNCYYEFTIPAFTPTITSVDVTPATANVQKGTTQQFNAAVTGTGAYDNTVAWTVEGGVSGTTISTSGLLTVDAAETTTTLTVKATANGDNSKTDTATVTVTSAPVTKYTLTVTNGTGDGDYEENAVVNISADAPATGKQFKNWTTSNGGSFANANSASTTYTMPAGVATVTANYENIPVTVSSIAVNSTGHKTAYTVGDALNVTGLTILVTKSDGSSSTFNVTNGMVSGFNSSAAATIQTLTITYEGKSTTYNVSISPVAATTYTINFNANGGSVGMASATTGTDGKLASLPTPTRSGSYSFKGWYTATSGGTQVTTSYVFSNNTTIYAQWNYTGGTGGGSGYTYYTITATAGAGGSIAPSGSSSVREGTDKAYTITPNTGYVISDVLVDGKSVGAVKTYTFDNVKKAHTISVTFKAGGHSNPQTGVDMDFTDVKDGDWFYEDVAYVFAEGLMNGTSATTFSPYANTTRGMIVTILYRLAGAPAVSGTNPFDDVKSGSYYEDAITWAAANKIVGGYGNGKFGPDDNITREQMAAILYRYAQFKGYDVSVGEDTNILSYTDAESVGEWAIPSMQWACGAGLINGSAGKLMPQGEATRAQVAAILHRFCENIVK